jgi:fluoride exporter
MSFITCLIVMLGGAVGSLARYAVSAMAGPFSTQLPWGTVILNVTGSFIIGFFGTLTLAHGRYPVSESIRILVMVGFCGGFTTFSAFSLQTLDLLRSGFALRAAINIVGSVVLCVAAVAAGHFLGARLNGGGVHIAQTFTEEEG